MKKILVTGSSGYIGRHVCKILGNKYYVRGLDRVYRPHMADQLIVRDICENVDVDGEYDAVVHLAALVQQGGSFLAPMDYYRTNITGTLNILERVYYKNFIFASTGMAKFGNSPYGLSKLAAESLVRQYCTLNNKDFTVFRFFNVTGTGGYEATNPDGLFYNLCKAANTGEFNLYGNDYNTPDGTAIRDYIHVLEVCRAIELAIERPSADSLVENLGTGEGYSVQTMIDTFKRVNNVDFKVNVLPRREGDIERSVLDEPSPYFQKVFDLETLLKL